MKSGYENGETQHLMHKVGDNCRKLYMCRSSENICSSSGGAQDKGKERIKTGRNSIWHKIGAFLSFTLKANVLFLAGFF